jgi:paraquat-inducible protein B
MEAMSMKNRVGGWLAIVGTGLCTMFVAVAAGASDKPTTGDRVIRETQEAVTATKDYTIQAELEEIQVHISKLRGQVDHASAEARTDIQKGISELERKRDLVKKKAEDIHSATASSWEQVKSKTSAAMDDLRDSVNRTLSHLP